MALTKNRTEKDVYQIIFTDRLASGETISSAEVIVERAVLYAWVEVTDEILGTVTQGPNVIQFVLRAAGTESEQLDGVYRVRATVVTSADRTLVGDADLRVTV